MTEEFDGVIGIVYQKTKPKKYLLIFNKKTGNITLPAGGREPEETNSRQTLEREILEETGLTPKDYVIIETGLVHEFIYGPKKKERAGQTARQPIYLVETKKTDLNPRDEDAKIEGWFTAEETLNKLTFEDSKELFKKAIKKIISFS